MEKIRYPWDWRVLLLGGGGFALAFGIAIISNPTHPKLWQFAAIFAAFLLFILINFTLGTFGLLNTKTGVLSRTDYLFFTKRLNVRDIKTVHYRPTWLIGGLAQSLYIVDYKGKVIEFPNVGWYEPVLAKIVNDLRQINAAIQLDEHAEALIKKYGHGRDPSKGEIDPADVHTRRAIAIGFVGVIASFVVFFTVGFGARSYFDAHPGSSLQVLLPMAMSSAAGFAAYAMSGRLKTAVLSGLGVMAFFLFIGFA